MHRRKMFGVTGILVLIVLVAGCGSAVKDRSADSTPDDPSTMHGSCRILVGDGAAKGAVKEAFAVKDSKLAVRAPVQDRLFSVVSKGPANLQDPSGQLIDYLDDPHAYVEGNGVAKMITDAADEIDTLCKGH